MLQNIPAVNSQFILGVTPKHAVRVGQRIMCQSLNSYEFTLTFPISCFIHYILDIKNPKGLGFTF